MDNLQNSVQDFNNGRGLNGLRPVDIAFLDDISQEINFQTGLSMTIDKNKILRIVRNCLRYSYDWYFKAIIERVGVVKQSDIASSYTSSGYAQLRLPNSVHALYNIQMATLTHFSKASRILDIPMLRSVGFSGETGVTSSTYNNYNVSDAVISLYELSSHRTHLKQTSVPFDYENGTQTLIIKTKVNTDLVLGVFNKIEPSALYNDYFFRNFVVGECLKSSARLFGTFDIELAGKSTINWSDMKSDGEDLVEEVKEYFKSTQTTPKILYK